MHVSAFLDEIRAEAWAMEPRRLEALAGVAQKASALSGPELAGALRRSFAMEPEEPELYERRGSCAVVTISGVLMRKVPEWFSWFSVDATETGKIGQALAAALDDEGVESIVLHVSSPGGQAQGVAEVADAIAAASKEKPVYCVVDSLCASGAYWLASQADSIVANRDAYLGSIGVYRVVVDSSKAAADMGYKVHVVRSGEHKGVGVPGAPITDAQLAAEQEVVDDFARMFKKAVKTGRDHEDIESVATGQVWLAKTAKTKGLIDDVEPASSALSRLAPEDTEDDMPRDKKAQAEQNDDPVAKARAEDKARLAALKAEFAEDKDFAFEQYEAGATVEEAKVAFNEVLRERLAAEKKAKADALAALEQEKAKKPIVAPQGGTPVPFGGAEPAGDRGSTDFVAAAKAYAKEHGVKLRDAMSAIAKQDPASHLEWVESRPLVKKNPDRQYERVTQKTSG